MPDRKTVQDTRKRTDIFRQNSTQLEIVWNNCSKLALTAQPYQKWRRYLNVKKKNPLMIPHHSSLKLCKFCKQSFVPRRSDALFCGTTCRWNHWRHKQESPHSPKNASVRLPLFKIIFVKGKRWRYFSISLSVNVSFFKQSA